MIPRRIHRWWNGEPCDAEQWITSALHALNPMWVVDDHADHPDWINFDQVIEEDQVRHISNIVRYDVLYRFGGVWVDHDVVPLKSFEDLVVEGPFTGAVRGAREGSFLAFPANHPMLAELLDDIKNSAQRQVRSADVSGAMVLERIGRGYPDVRLEDRVIPFDEKGRPLGVPDPHAVHLWTTSSRRAAGV